VATEPAPCHIQGMVKTWHSGSGGTHTCPHCGAVYEVTIHRFPVRDKDSAQCDVCEKTMKEWNDTASPSFKLIKRPGG
jgi:predicted Zn finger-like uncharacterized protein